MISTGPPEIFANGVTVTVQVGATPPITIPAFATKELSEEVPATFAHVIVLSESEMVNGIAAVEVSSLIV